MVLRGFFAFEGNLCIGRKAKKQASSNMRLFHNLINVRNMSKRLHCKSASIKERIKGTGSPDFVLFMDLALEERLRRKQAPI